MSPIDALHAAAVAHELIGGLEAGAALLESAPGDGAQPDLWLHHAGRAAPRARFDPRRQDEALGAARALLLPVARAHDPGTQLADDGEFDVPLALARRAPALAEGTGGALGILALLHVVVCVHLLAGLVALALHRRAPAAPSPAAALVA